MGTSSVAERTVAGVFAIQFILCESSAWQILTGARKASERIVARVLAGSVAVAQETLVDVLIVGRCGEQSPLNNNLQSDCCSVTMENQRMEQETDFSPNHN